MEYVTRRLADLKPYENNPRVNDDAVDDVAESIRQCTYVAPIIIDEEGVILAGHTRYKALKKLGYEECQVLLVSSLTEEQKKKFRLYDNKTAEFSEWNVTRLNAELDGLDFCGYDFGQPAFEPVAQENGKSVLTCPCCGEVFEA